MSTIIYPGTFDPMTLGHSNLIERAARLFDHVILAIAHSKRKEPLFNFNQRVTLAKACTSHISDVSVVGFSGLIVDLVKEYNATAVLRGVRSTADFDYELQMAEMNKAMLDSFETVFLTPATHLSFISSTLVREIATMGGDYANFVHPSVMQALQAKLG